LAPARGPFEWEYDLVVRVGECGGAEGIAKELFRASAGKKRVLVVLEGLRLEECLELARALYETLLTSTVVVAESKADGASNEPFGG